MDYNSRAFEKYVAVNKLKLMIQLQKLRGWNTQNEATTINNSSTCEKYHERTSFQPISWLTYTNKQN